MTPCAPRSWSRRRLLRALLGPTAVCVAAGLESLGAAQIVALLAGWVAFDAAAMAWGARAWSRGLRAELHVDASRAGGVHTGGEFALDVVLHGARWHGPVLLAPWVPHATRVLDQGGARAGRDPATPARARFRFRALQPGRLRFAGVIVRRASPFGLFQHAQFVPCAAELTVIPDARDVRDPRLIALRGASAQAASRRHAARVGAGTEFAELRAYRPGDPLGRVDWKATARRDALLVRDYESPTELAVHVLFDASVEMTARTLQTQGFARAAELVARLAWVASVAGHALHVQPFDERREAPIRSQPGTRGVQRLLSELVELPRRALASRARDGVAPRAARELTRSVLAARLTRRVDDAELDALLAARGAASPPTTEELLDLAADLDPLALAALHARCPECRAERFADELRCPRCGHGDAALAAQGLSPHAACLAGLLDEALRRRGREVLVLVLSLQGGQVVPAILRRLVLAARGARRVHVVVPRAADTSEWRPTHPASIPDRAFDVPVLTDMERLADATRARTLRLALRDEPVQLHALDDDASLEALLVELLRQEDLGA